ncbi:MAG: hypothetical protein R6U70_06065 [Bacillota bacterium]
MKQLARLSLYALIIFLLAGPLIVPGRSLLPPGAPGEHPVPDTAHTSRIQGEDVTDLSLRVTEMRFAPPARLADLFVVVPGDDPLAGLIALRLCARPVGAALVLLPPEPPLQPDVLSRMQAVTGNGESRASVLAAGDIHPDLLTALDSRFHLATLEGTHAELAVQVDELLAGRGVTGERHLIIPAEDHRHGLALVTWVAQTGDAVFPTGRDRLPDEIGRHLSRTAAEMEGRKMNLYLVAPKSLGTDALMEELNDYGQAVRVAGITPGESALALAGYFDAGTQFGWRGGTTREGNLYYLLGNPDHPGELLAAAPLFSETQSGPTLLTSSVRLSPAVETFLWTRRPHWVVVPAEGRHSFAWLAGGPEVMSWSVQHRADLINQPAPHDRAGFGGRDSVLLVWLVVAWLGGLWIWIHSVMRRPLMQQHVRLFWVLTGLVLGPLGLLSYYLVNRGDRPPVTAAQRLPLPEKALSATAAAAALAAGVIILTSCAYLVLRRPVVMIGGSIFFLGNPAVRGLLVGSILALGSAVLLMEPVLYASGGESYGKLLKDTWVGAAVAHAVAALVFCLGLWWLQTQYLSSPPRAIEILWWGTAAAAAAFTAVVTYPLNYWMVSQNVRKGVLS